MIMRYLENVPLMLVFCVFIYRVVVNVITITGSAVALHCVKAHRQSQWRSPNFNPL